MNNSNEQTLVEIREKYGDHVEVRTSEIRAHESKPMVVEGYASVFDSVYNIGFDETVDRGAFDNVLGDDVRFFFDHGGIPLARTKNDTLTLSVDDRGLHYRAELSDTTAGRDLFQAIQRGEVSQSSFAFQIENESRDAKGVRHIESVSRLLDVSAVSFPASGATEVLARKTKVEENPKPTKLRQNMAKMNLEKMTVSDLKAKRGQLSDEFNALSSGIEAEKRAATDAESEQLDNLDSEIERLDGYVVMREKQAKHEQRVARQANVGTTSRSEMRDIENVNKRFSLSRAITSVSNGRPLMGAELEWAMEAQQEAQRSGLRMQGQVGIPTIAMEKRANETDQFSATAAAAVDAGGPGFVPEVVPTAIDALHQPSFIETLGVQFIQAAGNIQMPKVITRPATTAALETGSASASGMQMGEVNLIPKRYSAETKYSKQLLLQGTSEVDTFIARQIVNAHNRQKDIYALAILTTASAAKVVSATANDLAYVDPASPGVLDEDILYAMESALVTSDTDFSNVQFVVGPGSLGKVRGFSHTGAGGAAMFDGTSLMGYRLTKTGRVNETALAQTTILANFGQALIGAAFGPLDLQIDPYTAASTAEIKLHTNQWFDVGLRQEGACAISTVATLA